MSCQDWLFWPGGEVSPLRNRRAWRTSAYHVSGMICFLWLCDLLHQSSPQFCSSIVCSMDAGLWPHVEMTYAWSAVNKLGFNPKVDPRGSVSARQSCVTVVGNGVCVAPRCCSPAKANGLQLCEDPLNSAQPSHPCERFRATHQHETISHAPLTHE
jgi:hypothetical protein